MTKNFYGGFFTEFPLAHRYVGLKPFGHLVVEFFDKGVGFFWRACRDFSVGYTCANSVMGPFIGIAGTTTPLVAYDQRGITYLAATNAGWLPFLADWFKGSKINIFDRQFKCKQVISILINL